MRRLMVLLVLSVCLCGFVMAQAVEFVHPTVMDKGKVSQGDVITGEIKFVNTSDSHVELEEVKASCGCTTVDPETMTFAPGDTATIPYTVETKNFNGVIRKNIKLMFKNVEPKTQMVVIQANVITDLAINPRFVNFQKLDVDPDTTISEYFEIENSSDSDIEIVRISTKSEYLSVFPESTVIPAGKSHLIRIDFKPQKEGRHNTRVTIESNHPLQSNLNLPVFVNVKS